MAKSKNRSTPSGKGMGPDSDGKRLSPSTHAGDGITWSTPKLLAAVIGIISLLVIAVYTNTLWYGAVFNDPISMSMIGFKDANPGTTAWMEMALRPLSQPWVRISFLTDQKSYGSTLGWYHLVNIFLHWSACVALFLLVYRVCIQLSTGWSRLDALKLSATAGLLYASHPLAVQSATYLSARYSALGPANYLLALNCLLLAVFAKSKTVRIWFWVFTAMFGMMTITSSEVGLSLPVSMVVLLFLVKPAKFTWKNWAIEHPFVFGILTAMAITFPFMAISGIVYAAAPNYFGFPLLDIVTYTATQAKALFTYYIRGLMVPLWLSLDPPFSKATSWADPFSIGGGILIFGSLFALLRFRQMPILQLSLMIALAGFLPHLFIRQQERVADGVFYLSLAGGCILIAWLLADQFRGSWTSFAQKVAPLLLVLCGLSIMHNLDFAKDANLIDATLKSNSNSALGHTLLAMDKNRTKEYQAAVDEANQALVEEPQLTLAFLAKGIALTHLEQYEKAQDELLRAQHYAQEQKLPIVSAVKYALAENYLKLKKPNDANRIIYSAFGDDPGNPRGIYLLGMVALERGIYQESYAYLRRAAEMGISEAMLPLARASLRTGRFGEAYEYAKMAEKVQDNAVTQTVLGNASLAVSELATAEQALSKALKSSPDNAEVLALLALLYEEKGDKVLAQSYRKDAISKDAGVFARLAMPQPPVGAPATKETVAAPTKKKPVQGKK